MRPNAEPRGLFYTWYMTEAAGTRAALFTHSPVEFTYISGIKNDIHKMAVGTKTTLFTKDIKHTKVLWMSVKLSSIVAIVVLRI